MLQFSVSCFLTARRRHREALTLGRMLQARGRFVDRWDLSDRWTGHVGFGRGTLFNRMLIGICWGLKR